ncbi:hypothetical protein G9P44_000462 [Scheffersomyces stipitis]|nr:hypothetical protein G9P44_000462 [Scheffersomyces stipitis]
MSSVLRRKQIHNVVSLSRRFSCSSKVSSAAASHENESILRSATSSTSIRSKLQNLPSARFCSSLQAVRELDDSIPVQMSREQKIKVELLKYADKKEYDIVLDLLLQWVQRDLIGMFATMTREEFAFIVNQVIVHQYTLLQRYASRRSLSKDVSGKSKDPLFLEAMHLVQKIRRLYSNILYVDPTEHIYGVDKRENLYSSDKLTGVKLSVADYENLVLMELHNYKFDLASKWFQRFAKEYALRMSYKLYILKLQTYCGGLPSSWLQSNAELARMNFDPKQSRFKWEHEVSAVMSEFYSENGNVKLDNEFNETVIYCIGYSKNIDYLNHHIYSVYGIAPNAEVNRNFEIMSTEDPAYPDINILTAIVVAMSHNDRFNTAMKVVSRFQEIYDIDTSGVKAKNFWQQIFKWCNLSNRYSEKSSLKIFSKITDGSKSKTARAHSSLESAKSDPNFDYEGYLEFVSHISNLRKTSFDQLWALYNEAGIGFSFQVYKTYLQYLRESIVEDREQKYYNYLSVLLNDYQKYNVNKKSFNTRNDPNFRAVSNIAGTIYDLYIVAMKSLIDIKWQATYAGQCPPLIEKWSLDDKMKKDLKLWFETNRLPKYKSMIEKKREEHMIKLRTDDKEEDSFLDLM